MVVNNDYTAAYIAEAEELLDDIEEILLQLEKDPDNGEAIRHLFRAIHTIKGSGMMFGFEKMAGFTHHVETALDQAREGTIRITDDFIDLLFCSRDQIKEMLYMNDSEIDAANEGAEIIFAGFNALMSSEDGPEGEKTDENQEGLQPLDFMDKGETRYHIQFQPHPDIMVTGTDPVLLLNCLGELGESTVTAHPEDIPDLKTLIPEQCHMFWDIILTTDHGLDAINDIFCFIEDECEITIQELGDDDSKEDRDDSSDTDFGPAGQEVVVEDMAVASIDPAIPADQEGFAEDMNMTSADTPISVDTDDNSSRFEEKYVPAGYVSPQNMNNSFKGPEEVVKPPVSQQKEAKHKGPVEYAIFNVGEVVCGLDIEAVREINRNMDITSVYLAPDYVRGVINLRGQIVSVIDLRRKFGMEHRELNDSMRILVVRSQEEDFGLLMDGVDDIVPLRVNEMDPPMPHVQETLGKYLSGIYKMEEQLVAVLDVEKVLKEAETT